MGQHIIRVHIYGRKDSITKVHLGKIGKKKYNKDAYQNV